MTAISLLRSLLRDVEHDLRAAREKSDAEVLAGLLARGVAS